MASWMGSEAAVKRVRLKSTLEEEVLADFRSEVDILSKVCCLHDHMLAPRSCPHASSQPLSIE